VSLRADRLEAVIADQQWRVAAHGFEVIASWGQAQLIKYLDGKLELKGGSKEDRIEAREWISM
jgi:hypothetical protein